MTPYFAPSRPRLFAHRGASAHFPENTLPAFAAAVAAGMGYLEMDVRATRDGRIVVHHDPTLLRQCGVDRPLSALTFEELRHLDGGWGFTPDCGQTFPWRCQGITIPTLAEVLAAYPHARYNIEIKQAEPAIEAAVLEVIRAAGAEDRVLLAAEQDVIMQRLRPLCGAIPTGFSIGETTAFFAWLEAGGRDAYTPPGVALQIPVQWQGRTLVTQTTLAAAHARGVEVHVWTINEPDEMARLRQLGVDGLMSDYPERLLAAAR